MRTIKHSVADYCKMFAEPMTNMTMIDEAISFIFVDDKTRLHEKREWELIEELTEYAILETW